jgi:putative ABC transport system ATP-binding protein
VQIELKDIHKTYHDSHGEPVRALSGVNLQIPSGDFVAISGSSGCGKSTLLNLMGCLDRPEKGACILDGEDVSAWPERRRAVFRNQRIGFVFQSFHLLPFLNVRENIELGTLYSRDTPRTVAGASELLASLGLEGMEKRYPTELSGGQQQRVAIARALALGADLLLADEPTGNLDPASAQTILDVFTDVSRRGRTIVLVTHDPAVASRAARQVQMAASRIVHDTRPAAAGGYV